MADSTQWRAGVFFDAIKSLGTGNTAGLFGAGVALHYFAARDPQIIWHIKAAAAWYLIGIGLFALAYFTFFLGTLALADETSNSKGPASDPAPVSPPLDSRPFIVTAIFSALGSLIVWCIGTGVAAKVIYLL